MSNWIIVLFYTANKMENKILVSVLMITYCHENYIKQAIEGVLMQKGNFDLQFAKGTIIGLIP